ncbi:hypothetical protein C1646_124453 [Rhizophagus diaphanus]|nr:hypothetical protein C1646_124453 [Rhizophagus diaphanus] [Rhizophagus sp. MUCL 43196]
MYYMGSLLKLKPVKFFLVAFIIFMVFSLIIFVELSLLFRSVFFFTIFRGTFFIIFVYYFHDIFL